MFNKYDTNRSGSLNEQELRKMLDELGLGVASTELDDLIKTIPTNDNKEVEFEQFFSAMQTGASAVFGSMQQNIEEKIFGRYETWDGEVEELTEASKNHCCGLAHPLAKRRQVYDMVQLCLLCYTLYSVPLQIAFSEEAQLNSPVFWIIECCV